MPDTVNYLFFAFLSLWVLVVWYIYKLRLKVLNLENILSDTEFFQRKNS